MTAQELIALLSDVDPSAVVVVDTVWAGKGLFPIADNIIPSFSCEIGDETYETVVLSPSRWP